MSENIVKDAMDSFAENYQQMPLKQQQFMADRLGVTYFRLLGLCRDVVLGKPKDRLLARLNLNLIGHHNVSA